MAHRRVFSGIQPTGQLHLGNYLGAISLWVAAQEGHEVIVCIADLHALTTPENVRATDLRAKVRETAAVLLACGIDPARAILFVQSRVGAHAELAWLLSYVTPVGWLERMIQFKTRSANLESVGTGLLMPSVQSLKTNGTRIVTPLPRPGSSGAPRTASPRPSRTVTARRSP